MLYDPWTILSVGMFLIGVVGFIIRKNIIVAFMCIELILNSANIALVVFGQRLNIFDGQITALFVMVVAAAEAAVGLAVTIKFFSNAGSIESDTANELKG